MKKILILVSCLFTLAACARITGNVDYPVTVELKHGASRTVDSGLTIRFLSVLNDSRCPIGVQCVWAGNAEIELELTGSVIESVGLNTGSQFPRTYTFEGYTVTLQDLKPQPSSGQTVDEASYIAVLSVDKEAAPAQ